MEIFFEEPVVAEKLEIVCSVPGQEYPLRIFPVDLGKNADGMIVNCAFRTDILSSVGILFGNTSESDFLPAQEEVSVPNPEEESILTSEVPSPAPAETWAIMVTESPAPEYGAGQDEAAEEIPTSENDVTDESSMQRMKQQKRLRRPKMRWQ